MSTPEDDTFLEIVTLTCLRCGHSWIRRKVTPPKNCPKCISPYWNKPRQRGKRSEKSEKKEITEDTSRSATDEQRDSGIVEVRTPDKEVVKDGNLVFPPYLCCRAQKRYDKDEDKV